MVKLAICKVPNILAYLALIYIIASIYYLVITRNISTPLSDAINKDPKLRKIKNASKKKRKNIFFNRMIMSIIILTILQPFKNCNCSPN